jgi:hypothetical protein
MTLILTERKRRKGKEKPRIEGEGEKNRLLKNALIFCHCSSLDSNKTTEVLFSLYFLHI